jgi:hypothetical protein
MNIEELNAQRLAHEALIASELSILECLEDAFLTLKNEGQPFAKIDVIRLASEYRANDPLTPVAEKRMISYNVFAKPAKGRIRDLSEEINQYTDRWRSIIRSERSRGVRRLRPKPPSIPLSARPA